LPFVGTECQASVSKSSGALSRSELRSPMRHLSVRRKDVAASLVLSCAAQGQDHCTPPGLDHEHGDAVSLSMPLSQTRRRLLVPSIPPQNASFVAGVLSKSQISFGLGVNVPSARGRRKGLAPNPPLGPGAVDGSTAPPTAAATESTSHGPWPPPAGRRPTLLTSINHLS
jgi:hypothetical protein